MGPEMERYVSRLSYMLRHGRHVADIAVLYPIAALQSAYFFATPVASNRGGGDQPTFLYALEGASCPRRSTTWIWARCSTADFAWITRTCTPRFWPISA